eukprot:m.36090 g.36090  ORF g.36090 m.36090 type:complete len:464 (+) comp15914_c0_seq1:376-1767(+)
MGILRDIFDGSVHQSLICSICQDILLTPMEGAACGHLFCLSCIEQWFQRSKSRTCPECRAAINQLKSSRVVANIIADLPVKAGEDSGCTWTGTADDYVRQHRTKCLHCQAYEQGIDIEELRKAQNAQNLTGEGKDPPDDSHTSSSQGAAAVGGRFQRRIMRIRSANASGRVLDPYSPILVRSMITTDPTNLQDQLPPPTTKDYLVDWVHTLYFLMLSAVAGVYVAHGQLVHTWASLAFSLLGVLEPSTTYVVFASTLYVLLDVTATINPSTFWERLWGALVWIIIIMLPQKLGTIKSTTQRDIAPQMVLSLGNMCVALAGYYHVALLVISGAMGYYCAVADVHRYVMCSGMLVLGVLLPFAVRRYRQRLSVDDLPPWVSGVDDLRLIYLLASVYVALDIFKNVAFENDSRVYEVLSGLSLVSLFLFDVLVVTEACLLGASNHKQIVAVITPLCLLVLLYPNQG